MKGGKCNIYETNFLLLSCMSIICPNVLMSYLVFLPEGKESMYIHIPLNYN